MVHHVKVHRDEMQRQRRLDGCRVGARMLNTYKRELSGVTEACLPLYWSGWLAARPLAVRKEGSIKVLVGLELGSE